MDLKSIEKLGFEQNVKSLLYDLYSNFVLPEALNMDS